MDETEIRQQLDIARRRGKVSVGEARRIVSKSQSEYKKNNPNAKISKSNLDSAKNADGSEVKRGQVSESQARKMTAESQIKAQEKGQISKISQRTADYLTIRSQVEAYRKGQISRVSGKTEEAINRRKAQTYKEKLDQTINKRSDIRKSERISALVGSKVDDRALNKSLYQITGGRGYSFIDMSKIPVSKKTTPKPPELKRAEISKWSKIKQKVDLASGGTLGNIGRAYKENKQQLPWYGRASLNLVEYSVIGKGIGAAASVGVKALTTASKLVSKIPVIKTSGKITTSVLNKNPVRPITNLLKNTKLRSRAANTIAGVTTAGDVGANVYIETERTGSLKKGLEEGAVVLVRDIGAMKGFASGYASTNKKIDQSLDAIKDSKSYTNFKFNLKQATGSSYSADEIGGLVKKGVIKNPNSINPTAKGNFLLKKDRFGNWFASPEADILRKQRTLSGKAITESTRKLLTKDVNPNLVAKYGDEAIYMSRKAPDQIIIDDTRTSEDLLNFLKGNIRSPQTSLVRRDPLIQAVNKKTGEKLIIRSTNIKPDIDVPVGLTDINKANFGKNMLVDPNRAYLNLNLVKTHTGYKLADKFTNYKQLGKYTLRSTGKKYLQPNTKIREINELKLLRKTFDEQKTLFNFQKKKVLDLNKLTEKKISFSSSRPTEKVRQFSKKPSTTRGGTITSDGSSGQSSILLGVTKEQAKQSARYSTANEILTRNKIGQDIFGTRGFKTWSEQTVQQTSENIKKITSFKPQTWKDKEKLGVLLFTGVKPIETLSDKNATVTKQTPDSETIIIQDQEEEPLIKTVPDTKTKIISDTDTASDTKQGQESTQIPITDTSATTTTTPTPTPTPTPTTTDSNITKETGGGIPPFFFKIKPNYFTSNKKRNAFDVYIRQKGKFTKLNKKPLPKNKALNFGADIVDESSAVSFQIKKSKKKTSMIDDFSFLYNHKFRNKKNKSKIKENPVFIEKNKFRIDTPGELKDITAKGIMKNRRKGLLKGFSKRINLKKGIF